MSKVKMKFMPTVMRTEFYDTHPDNRHEFVQKYLYVFHAFKEFNLQISNPLDCLDEVFDIASNPNRREERNHLLSDLLFRDFGLGDVVEIDGTNWMCDSVGWKKLVDSP